VSVLDCHLVEFPKIHDPRGNLTFLEGEQHVDWPIRRVYYLYDVPGGAERGGHAHKLNEELLIAVSGSFDVVLKDGVTEQRYQLNRPDRGLRVAATTWRELENFSSGAVCLVLASELYDEADYYRDWREFLVAAGEQRRMRLVA
jgi:hypothetical protein